MKTNTQTPDALSPEEFHLIEWLRKIAHRWQDNGLLPSFKIRAAATMLRMHYLAACLGREDLPPVPSDAVPLLTEFGQMIHDQGAALTPIQRIGCLLYLENTLEQILREKPESPNSEART